jgi:hypothetical protein
VTVREIERFLRNKDAGKLHMISDPETVIKALQKQRRLYMARRLAYLKG